MRGKYETTIALIVVAIFTLNFTFLSYIYPSLRKKEDNLITAYNSTQKQVKEKLLLIEGGENIFTKLLWVHNQIKLAKENLANIKTKKEKFDIADFMSSVQECGVKIESLTQKSISQSAKHGVVDRQFSVVLQDSVADMVRLIGCIEDYSPIVEVSSYSIQYQSDGKLKEQMVVKAVSVGR